MAGEQAFQADAVGLVVEKQLLDLVRPLEAGPALDLAQGRDHGVRVLGQFDRPGVSDEFAQSLIAFNKQVAKEDDDLTDSVQRGLLGGIPDRGRFLTSSEHLIVHFQKMIVKAVAQ